MRRSRTSPRLSGVRACAIAIALCLVPLAAQGEVRVDGNPAAIRITTHHDSINNVLAALRTSFHVQHRSAIALDMPANPTYAGPLDRVIANLLDDFNYIVKKSPAETEIIILGHHGEAAMPPQKPRLDILSRWR
jgi:hypothetical protein